MVGGSNKNVEKIQIDPLKKKKITVHLPDPTDQNLFNSQNLKIQ